MSSIGGPILPSAFYGLRLNTRTSSPSSVSRSLQSFFPSPSLSPAARPPSLARLQTLLPLPIPLLSHLSFPMPPAYQVYLTPTITLSSPCPRTCLPFWGTLLSLVTRVPHESLTFCANYATSSALRCDTQGRISKEAKRTCSVHALRAISACACLACECSGENMKLCHAPFHRALFLHYKLNHGMSGMRLLIRIDDEQTHVMAHDGKREEELCDTPQTTLQTNLCSSRTHLSYSRLEARTASWGHF